MPMQEHATFTIEGQLCFALWTASRAVTSAYRDGLAEIGLTYTQYVVMLTLWDRGSVSLGELSTTLHLDSGTLSPLLKRMESRALVSRERRVQDERVLDVTLTEAGSELYDHARAVQHRVEQATGLNPSQLATLRDELHALTARLDVAMAARVV